jgi:hypothetical protein
MDALQNLPKDIEQVPDMMDLVDQLTSIFEFMTEPEIAELRRTNFEQFEDMMYNKYQGFCDKYFTLFAMVIHYDPEKDDKSLDNLVMMINALCMVKLGKISVDTANTVIGEELAEKYIYSKHGGKKKFEKHVQEYDRQQKLNKKKKDEK